MSPETTKKLLPLKDVVVGAFTAENWNELGILTGTLDWIRNHPRLLRSLSWSDGDYSGHVLSALIRMVEVDEANFEVIKEYIEEKLGPEGEYVSSTPTIGRKITFSPFVFQGRAALRRQAVWYDADVWRGGGGGQ